MDKVITEAMKKKFRTAVDRVDVLQYQWLITREITAAQLIKKLAAPMKKLEEVHDAAPSSQISTESAILNVQSLIKRAEQVVAFKKK